MTLTAILTAALVSFPPEKPPYGPITPVDGDTVRVGDQRVRAIGYNTPERRTKADDLVSAWIAQGKLHLVYARCNNGRIMRGKSRSRRPLAWFMVDGNDIGPGLIAEGLATEFNGGKPLGDC